ncbi:MAG: hypothetical protein IH898_13565 [Planctomycetes bacterium]|nr:hypothetical protein [Planctomycetota bacterium]
MSSELDVYSSLVPVVYEVADANGEASVRILTDLAPDLIVLGSSRILQRHVITIPRIGILNAHAGLLTAYRGVDVISWALHNRDPLGVTIHFVDAGVDTGATVTQRCIELSSGDTLSSLTSKAHVLLRELMADVIAQLIATGRVESIKLDPKAGKQYYRMPPSLLAATEAKLAEHASGQKNRPICKRWKSRGHSPALGMELVVRGCGRSVRSKSQNGTCASSAVPNMLRWPSYPMSYLHRISELLPLIRSEKLASNAIDSFESNRMSGLQEMPPNICNDSVPPWKMNHD